MNRDQVIAIADSHLLPAIRERYGLANAKISVIEGHDGGRNLFYLCENGEAGDKVIRIVFLPDRTAQDILGELAFVRYLAAQGAGVADVIDSRQGRLLEEISHDGQIFFVSVFEKAKGEQLADHGYRYREGAPLTEYFYNIGKTLGKIHELSKRYDPVHPRYSFFDKYTPEFIQRIIPASLPKLKGKFLKLLQTLAGLERTPETFGLVHFDYSDGNYMIDYATGDLTVFDFDNACACWYLVDLANVWVHGVGWIQFEPDAEKRQRFMSEYFGTVLEGYRSETRISEEMLKYLPLFIQVTVMESVIDAFEVMRHNGEQPECDESLAYLIKCVEDDIPYMGFFDEIYNCDEPFEYEAQ
jgi:Ser/Thr protein kinase RdoA (MazF antagonist)